MSLEELLQHAADFAKTVFEGEGFVPVPELNHSAEPSTDQSQAQFIHRPETRLACNDFEPCRHSCCLSAGNVYDRHVELRLRYGVSFPRGVDDGARAGEAPQHK